ncbi:MAG: NAD(P)-dependent oxidoreductase [Oscillospiraceae bacterium]|nr:NAD(P)-dependent oxidoreductase [Oscillospiraceae bacterium]
MNTSAELMEFMTRPSTRLVEDISKIDGDILILGAGGKVGPSLAVMAARACKDAGIKKRVLAVSLFDSSATVEAMRSYGVEVLEADLFDPEQLVALPDCPNIIFMAGRKFGTSGNQALTWAVNVLLPARICERFPSSRFVVFSTGNVYGDVPILSGGSAEGDTPNPDGEYGQTCLGRERVFEYYATKSGQKSLFFRLNYAIELRYGVLFDIASSVYNGNPVSLGRGVYNCIWQGDVCEYAIRSLRHTSNPPCALNVTGPQCISTKWTAKKFGEIFGKEPLFISEERPFGIFSNTTKLGGLLGTPSITLDEMIRWQAEWIQSGGESIAAPTHFEQVDGKY